MPRRPFDRTQLSAVLLSTLLAVSIVGAVALAPAVAEHPDDAEDYTGQAYFEISEVSESDHYPGQDEGSIQYFAGGSEAFEEQDAEEGVWIDYIIIDSIYDGEQWIDYSDCDVDNTAAFGIDRGNNNSGTNYDEDLVQKQKQVDFRDDGITIEFYDWDDLGNDPPYMAPEDAIVAQQGEGSAGGGCLSMTEETGWYRIAGFLNGTVADNGRNDPPSEDAGEGEVAVQSTWWYVCDCDSREEAEEELGPPPEDDSEAQADEGEGPSDDGSGEDDGSEEGTPEGDAETATPEDGGEATAEEETATPEDDGEATAEEEPATEGDGDEPATEGDEPATEGDGEEPATEGEEPATEGDGEEPATEGEEGPTGNDTNATGNDTGLGDDDEQTPEGDGAGFGPLVAILALLGSALLLNRRR